MIRIPPNRQFNCGSELLGEPKRWS